VTLAAVDAGDALKWFIGARPGEDDVDAAMRLLWAVAGADRGGQFRYMLR
jgi:hypothetical protein